jgi:ABC-2 type transport system permease protein
MKHIFIILQKDLLEIRLQRTLMFGIILPALVFTVLPIVIAFALGHANPNASNTNNSSAMLSSLGLTGLTAQEAAQVVTVKQIAIIYLMLPGLLTSVIASYSIVGEKSSRTLEPILATPIRTWELLMGKCLASLVPGIGLTWLSGLIFIIAMAIVAVSQRAFAAIVSPGWLVLFLVWAPLLAIIANAFMIAISSRVNEPRTAQQLSAWLVVPFMAVFFSQLAGIQVLGPLVVLVTAFVLLIIAVAAMWGATTLFQREAILTRWK